MTTRLFVLLLTALTALVLNVRGQTLVDGLPDRLPIGDESLYLNWIATNSPAYVAAGFRYTNSIGNNFNVMPYSVPIELNSFADFEGWVYQIGNEAVNSVKSLQGDNRIPPDNAFHFTALLVHHMQDGTEYGTPVIWVAISVDFPHFSKITADSFRNLPYSALYQMFYIKGLDKIEIKVPNKHYMIWEKGTTAKYKYEGVVNQQDGFIPPKEYLIPDILTLGKWYSTARYPGTRFIIGANGHEQTYTEYGLPLGVSLEVNRNSFVVHAAAGSQVKVEYTEDFKSWHSLTNFQATPENTTFVIPVYTDQPQRFLRASAY